MMTFEEYIETLTIESDRFAIAIAAASPQAVPASCPEWNVRDLALHVGMVQRWATYMLVHPGQKPPPDVAGEAPSADHLDRWLRTGSASLIQALADADPNGTYFTFLEAAPPPRVFWARRQAHEVAMHRVDAQIALGMVDAFELEFAIDGIDEMLTGFLPREHSKLRSETPRTLLVAPSDSSQRWLVTITSDPPVTIRGGGVAADCVVSGYATDILLAFWNRTSKESLDVSGDADILGLFGQTMQIRWA